MAKNGEMTSRQRRMITALLTSENIGAACEAAKVGRTTLARWLEQGTFLTALRKAQGEAMTKATSQLIAAQEEAINTLLTLARRARSESVKRAAANDLLAYSLKYNDHNIEDRLTALEKAVNNGK
jgi:hypothetical protein